MGLAWTRSLHFYIPLRVPFPRPCRSQPKNHFSVLLPWALGLKSLAATEMDNPPTLLSICPDHPFHPRIMYPTEWSPWDSLCNLPPRTVDDPGGVIGLPWVTLVGTGTVSRSIFCTLCPLVPLIDGQGISVDTLSQTELFE